MNEEVFWLNQGLIKCSSKRGSLGSVKFVLWLGASTAALMKFQRKGIGVGSV